MTNTLHPTEDPILNKLSNLEGSIGDFVIRYPGKNRTEFDPKWLEEWFLERVNHIRDHLDQVETSANYLDSLLSDLANQQASVVNKPASIVSLWPHYFRGFRNPESPINLSGRLIVLDGRNSSGKTSLAEAFEWLLSGQLSRRYYSDLGDAEELENCIGNQLRPDSEKTWVEAQFSTPGGEIIKVKRVLTLDYCKEKTSTAKSEFYVNDVKLSRQEEENFLDDLIANTPPVLMQHSLRTFVLSTPRERRDYFERLLRLDEIADLIEKSVIGNVKLIEFPSPLGSVAWKNWEGFLAQIPPEHRRTLKRVEQASRESIKSDTNAGLLDVSRKIFELPDKNAGLEETTREIESIQRQKRATSFPALDSLRPTKMIDPQLLDLFSQIDKEQTINLETQHQVLVEANRRAEKVGEAQLVISEAMEKLSVIGIVVETTENQTCPMCESTSPTLTQDRVKIVQSWQPIQKNLQNAEDRYRNNVDLLKTRIKDLVTARKGLIPEVPNEEEWGETIKSTSDPIKNAAEDCKKVLQKCNKELLQFDDNCDRIATLLAVDLVKQDISEIMVRINKLVTLLGSVIDQAHEYLDGFNILDNIVGTQARDDADYNLREMWLSLVKNIDGLTADFLWEQSKKRVQDELVGIRQCLVNVRDKIIESRRTAFSEGMTSIWGKLRSDRYSAFSGLIIPPPRGKGLPLEIKVKAILDDAIQQKEVDALRVFSESQINILGIAAFTTRSKLLGHRMIILDDPVQSMDEEHFKTFVNQLLPELLGEDGQVIVLTHNDMFARDLSYAWAGSAPDFFVTMVIDHRRKQGCVVQEGNRRVFERIKLAEKFADNGDLTNAWITVRRAIERFYTLVQIKYGNPGFDHYSWRNSTGEDMFNQGAGAILDSKGADTKKLRDILSMTAAAAHDKTPYGITDLINSLTFIRKLAIELKIDC